MADSSKRLIKCRPSGFVSRDWQAPRVRFTHNEIERKRRARLKSETDFLHQQLPKAVYRDKLAIFKAGTELLLRYADSNGPEARSLILTDNEYSECILKNFDGFGMRIRCSDSTILAATKNGQSSFGPDFTSSIGKTLHEIVVSTELTQEIIKSNLSLSSEEHDQLASGQPVSRSFLLPIIDTSKPPTVESYYLLECCGDIVMSACFDQNDNEPVLGVICRVVEHRSPDQTTTSNGKLFSLRLQPDSHLISELHGDSLPNGISPSDMIGRSLLDLIAPTSRPEAESNLHNAERTGKATFTVRLDSSPAMQFLVVATAITACNCLYCLVADFYPPQP